MAPIVEIRTSEVELAPGTILLRSDRPLGGELSECVPMNTEILGGVTRVEPLVGRLIDAAQLFDNHRRNTIGELSDQTVDDGNLNGPRCWRRSLCRRVLHGSKLLRLVA